MLSNLINQIKKDLDENKNVNATSSLNYIAFNLDRIKNDTCSAQVLELISLLGDLETRFTNDKELNERDYC